MSTRGISREDLGDGSSIIMAPYDESIAQKAVTDNMQDKVSTPDPGAKSDSSGHSNTGPINRFNEVFTELGSTMLEALGLQGYEISKAIRTRRDELFRNQFPIIVPRFYKKCEKCDAEYDEDVDFCHDCTRRNAADDLGEGAYRMEIEDIPEQYRDGSLRRPKRSQKREAHRLFKSVNKEGQSLRELLDNCDGDHCRLGVGAFIVKKNYHVAQGDAGVMGQPLFERGQIWHESVDELVRADPKRVVPVTDANGRIGNWKWTCPVHRKAGADDTPGTCDKCGTELREIYYVEKPYVRSKKASKYYFEDEVISWAHFFPRHHGLDGLSPVHHIWLKQAILHWMDVYAGAYYDPTSKRHPNKFMVVHTTNADAWERNFEKSEDEAQENLYANQIFVNEYATDSQSTPEIQTVELMDDHLLGQDEQIKKQYKSDIRQHFGITDAMDSELEDAGGLNNEGLQLEVTDRNIASAQNKYVTGPLDDLMKVLGFNDWKLVFVPPEERDLESLQHKIEVGGEAADRGLDARIEDGELQVDDGDIEEDTSAEGGGLFAAEPDEAEQQVDWKSMHEKLDDGFEHIVWADETTKASPFFERDIPQAVRDTIEKVIDEGALFDDIDGLEASEDLKSFFKDTLTEPDGWSLSSIVDGLVDRFDISRDQAEAVGRTESASVLNNAKEKTIEEQDREDDVKVRWIGPDDHRTTDACEELKSRTEDGVTMDELIEIEKDVQQKHFPNLDKFRPHVVHPNERHTFVETFCENAVPGKLEVVA